LVFHAAFIQQADEMLLCLDEGFAGGRIDVSNLLPLLQGIRPEILGRHRGQVVES
jgi:hypothetical protein